MKKTALLFLVLVAAAFSSCQKTEEGSKDMLLGIHVQSWFSEDDVQVWIDGEEVINGIMNTEPSTGACYTNGIVASTQSEGEHEIKVQVNSDTPFIDSFTLSDTLYVGINYDPQVNEVHLVYSTEPFMYD